ncbi:DUF354 domain-containing protein [Infirmifilum sp. NZ]|uniref:DUF354 domain-containing protein n=1 Tax=Infirmifilum sp. NZ TaxID=2926850 RepID=UPI00279B9CCE|nr:DUF354 domain-containing protein [Infirmifilum sp. NZ]UNQ72891.1 DUF354 domain-containing protein [Infirmifilum sp. NZ]
MKIWVEALTPKQVLLFSYLQKELSGAEVFLTTRDYDLNAALASRLWSKYYIVGRYGGSTPLAKLYESVSRQRALARIVSHERPDVHVTFVSPDSTRVAFALGIKAITSSDSPHSDAVSRLAIPLSNKLVVPEFLAKSFEGYKALVEVVTFKGLFELAWLLREQPDPKVPLELGLEPFNYVVVRPGEHKAYYYPDPGRALTTPLAVCKYVLERTDLDVVVYPRYPDQASLFRRALRRWENRVKILDGPAHFVSLEFYARLVVSGGGTMATEAALMGTPALSTYPGELEVHEYIKTRGFPIFKAPLNSRILNFILSRGGSEAERRAYLEKTRSTMEDPVKVYAREILKTMR